MLWAVVERVVIEAVLGISIGLVGAWGLVAGVKKYRAEVRRAPVADRKPQVTELDMQYRIAARMLAKFAELKRAGKPLSQEQEAAVYSVVAEAHHE